MLCETHYRSLCLELDPALQMCLTSVEWKGSIISVSLLLMFFLMQSRMILATKRSRTCGLMFKFVVTRTQAFFCEVCRCVCQYLLVHSCRPPATSFGWLEWTRPWTWRMWSLKIIPLSWTPFSPGCIHGILPSRPWKGHSLLSWSPGLWSCYLLSYSC